MASESTALIQVASGLEKLMVGNPMSGPIRDSNVAQISAFLYYQANVMGKLEENQEFKNLFKTTIFNQIDKDFGLYIDAMARTKPKSLHHVYEWNKTGVSAARLFNLTPVPGAGISFGINYNFKISKSTVPNRNKKQKTKYKFANKASVMEAGMPITIRPRSAERLVFELDGITVFMPKGSSVTVKSPGGKASTNRFSLAYNIFFSGNLVNLSIKNSGFQQIFGSKISQALSLPANIKKVRYSFSPNTVRRQADFELTKAFGGSL